MASFGVYCPLPNTKQVVLFHNCLCTYKNAVLIKYSLWNFVPFALTALRGCAVCCLCLEVFKPWQILGRAAGSFA